MRAVVPLIILHLRPEAAPAVFHLSFICAHRCASVAKTARLKIFSNSLSAFPPVWTYTIKGQNRQATGAGRGFLGKSQVFSRLHGKWRRTDGKIPGLAGKNPRMLGKNPRLVGKKSRLVGNNPRIIAGNPRLAGKNPRRIPQPPRKVGEPPRKFGGNPRMFGAPPGKVDRNPRVAVTPRWPVGQSPPRVRFNFGRAVLRHRRASPPRRPTTG